MSRPDEATEARRPSKFRFALVVAVIIALLALLAWRFGASQVVAIMAGLKLGELLSAQLLRWAGFPPRGER